MQRGIMFLVPTDNFHQKQKMNEPATDDPETRFGGESMCLLSQNGISNSKRLVEMFGRMRGTE